MNFFEHQERARRHTVRLVVLFALAVLIIIVAIDAVVLLFFGTTAPKGKGASGGDFLGDNLGLIVGVAIAVLAGIALASTLRMLSLRGGGGKVASQLGGVPVTPDATDPLRRRLYNVVEEMAIASGVPVPEVYVLEKEAGINAFAAGYSTADAAVAVTQGTLEQLDRDELQGVIAHEFSHILNGDMRLNIRLIGLLFGILVLAIIGRFAIYASGRDRNGMAIVVIGLAVMLIGYIGLFFGRWIQASVSRQREFLADASAVQFTRNPDGLAGALKRIGATEAGSRLEAQTSEVSHMLFAGGAIERIFATHPPLEERIRAIDPSFQPEEITELAKQMQRDGAGRRAEVGAGAVAEAAGERGRGARGAGALDADAVVAGIGVPGVEQVLAAGAVASAIPDPITQAAHSVEWAPEVLCYLLVDADPQVRDAQLAMVRDARGAESERQVRDLLDVSAELPPEQRLPLLEITFPALRRRPAEELRDLLGLIDRLVMADRRVSAYEYALARLTAVQLEDALDPERSSVDGRRRLGQVRDEAVELLAALARHGAADDASAQAAYEAGAARIVDVPPPMPAPAEDWAPRLDAVLAKLDRLRSADKQRLVEGLATVVLHDADVATSELELMRAICATIHVPLPVLDRS